MSIHYVLHLMSIFSQIILMALAIYLENSAKLFEDCLINIRISSICTILVNINMTMFEEIVVFIQIKPNLLSSMFALWINSLLIPQDCGVISALNHPVSFTASTALFLLLTVYRTERWFTSNNFSTCQFQHFEIQ
jgi:hypothetical protein